MKGIFNAMFIYAFTLSQCNAQMISVPNNWEVISRDLLYAVRTNNHSQTDSLKLLLKNAEWETIQSQINNDEKKLAFWLNIYNAFIQDILSKNAGAYQNRSVFFKKKQIPIANQLISFDFVEHGILRRSKAKISLGYWNKLFPGKLERKLRVQKPDYRIHFALNCGASSCPPIAFYNSNEINSQLNIAETSFLTVNSKVNESEKQVNVTALVSWFRADFGGKKGIKSLLLKHKIIPDKNYKLKFNPYNWSLELNNYRE